MTTVAEGWWCTRCEVFEDDDTAGSDFTEQCLGCGCDGAEHERAEVVTK